MLAADIWNAGMCTRLMLMQERVGQFWLVLRRRRGSCRHTPSAHSLPPLLNPDSHPPTHLSLPTLCPIVQFLPFIQGPRNCLGQYFALLEARVILSTLCQVSAACFCLLRTCLVHVFALHMCKGQRVDH